MRSFLAYTFLFVSAAGIASAVELTSDSVAAFDSYIADFESHRLAAERFLTSDADPAHHQQLLRGDIVIEPGKHNGETELKAGIIHDWVGGVFIPSTTLDKVLGIAQDYSHQKDFYWPDIADSRVRWRRGDDFDVYARIVKSKLLVTDVLNTESEVHFTRVGAHRVICRSYSTRIAEVANPGTSKERELPVGKDRGLLWRLYGYWFFEERDGGVYAEYESITLSRNIPFGMGAVLGPILHNVPAESLRTSLERTRKAVTAAGVRNSD
jgi:hypothetical protein